MAHGGRVRLAAPAVVAGALPLPPAPVAAHSCSGSSGFRRRLRQHVTATHATLSVSGGSSPAQPGTARLHSLRLGTAPAQPSWGPRLPHRRLHAFSPALPEQPGDRQQGQQHHGQQQQQQHEQQQRGMASLPRWRFWMRGSSGSGDRGDPAAGGAAASAAVGGLVPPAPLPADTPSASQERELRAVNVAVLVNGAIFLAKMATWLVTGSGWVLDGSVLLAPRVLPLCINNLAPHACRALRPLLAWLLSPLLAAHCQGCPFPRGPPPLRGTCPSSCPAPSPAPQRVAG